MGKQRYWHCIIGPVDDDKIPWGGDSPPRRAAINAALNMLGVQPDCSSGWVDGDKLVEETTAMAQRQLNYQERKSAPPPTTQAIIECLPKWIEAYVGQGVLVSASRNAHMNGMDWSANTLTENDAIVIINEFAAYCEAHGNMLHGVKTIDVLKFLTSCAQAMRLQEEFARAIITDLINFVAVRNGVDYGLYSRDLL